MKIIQSPFLVFTLFFLVTITHSHSSIAATSEDIIDGFSEFLIERANANLVAVFERRLKDNENFQCYFPNTYKKIDTISLQNLFASKEYWKSSLSEDLEVLLNRSIVMATRKSVERIDQLIKSGLAQVDRNQVIEILQLLTYKYKNDYYPMNQIGTEWEPDLVKQVNGFTLELSNILAFKSEPLFFGSICQLDTLRIEELFAKLENLLALKDSLEKWVNHITLYGSNLRIKDKAALEKFCARKEVELCAIDDNADKAKSLISSAQLKNAIKALEGIERIKKAKAAYQALDKGQKDKINKAALLLPLLASATFLKDDIKAARQALKEAKAAKTDKERKEKIVATISAIKQKVDKADKDAEKIKSVLSSLIEDEKTYVERALISLEALKGTEVFSDANYERLNKSVMFFASIADSKDKDAVKNILEVYTLPAVSFMEKRKQGGGFFFSSYLGFSASYSDEQLYDKESWHGGLFVPVGVEYNYGCSDGGSYSIMFSPLDMANPINYKLKGTTNDVEFEEIVAPSITFSYGLPNYPLNIGLGYQYAKNLNDIDIKEERFLMFFSFDMPLYRLY